SEGDITGAEEEGVDKGVGSETIGEIEGPGVLGKGEEGGTLMAKVGTRLGVVSVGPDKEVSEKGRRERVTAVLG
ncbi:hypothetical protein A2U01_0105813, partial [Trifolium medium]|nr:hypothetical protein [Trifolium medium]